LELCNVEIQGEKEGVKRPLLCWAEQQVCIHLCLESDGLGDWPLSSPPHVFFLTSSACKPNMLARPGGCRLCCPRGPCEEIPPKMLSRSLTPTSSETLREPDRRTPGSLLHGEYSFPTALLNLICCGRTES
jgi:hypothetical protein